MRGKRVSVLLFLVVLLAACKSESLEEAIKTDVPFNIKKIIYTEKVKNGEIIFYITEQKIENEPIEALAVAFMKKDEKGWENAGNNHWDYRENPNMTVYMNTFYDYDKKGWLIQRIPLVFGRVKNNSIQTVQLTKENSKSEYAKLIYRDGERYFINLGEYFIVEGLDRKREVVERYEKKK